jgi:Domain of unknown function (DUF4179)
MDKQWFNDEMNKVEVPKMELRVAIQKGIERGKQEKPTKKGKIRFIKKVGLAAAITFSVLASGLVFSQMNSVVATVPSMADVYESIGDRVGATLAKKKLVTELGEEVTNNGVTIKVIGAYYELDEIQVIFSIDRKSEPASEDQLNIKYEVEGFDWRGANDNGIRDLGDGEKVYTRVYLEIPPEEDELKEYTLPIKFTNIEGVEGEWNFNIDVKQLEYTEHETEQVYEDKNGEYKVMFDKITKGQGTTIVDYTVLTKYRRDQLNFKPLAKDETGEPYYGASHSGSYVGKEGDYYKYAGQMRFETIPGNPNVVPMEVSLMREEGDRYVPLDKLPYTVQSKFTDEKFVINSVEQQGRKLIVNYEAKIDINKHEEEGYVFKSDAIAQNFLSFGLYETEYAKKVELDPFGPYIEPEQGTYLHHNIESKVIDREKGQAQAIFDLDGKVAEGWTYPKKQEPIKQFDKSKYSLRVPTILFNSLPANKQEFELKLK